jgi:hypothetical protein
VLPPPPSSSAVVIDVILDYRKVQRPRAHVFPEPHYGGVAATAAFHPRPDVCALCVAQGLCSANGDPVAG